MATWIGARLEGLRRIEVEVRGGWVQTEGSLDWRGLAVADEPLVGVCFLEARRETVWAKSPPATVDGVSIHVAVFGYRDVGDSAQVSVHFATGGLPRTQPTWTISGVTAFDAPRFETGRVHPLVAIDGEPPVAVGVLFIAAAQVKVGRNRLWRLRAEHATELAEHQSSLLTGGRGGIARASALDE